MNDLRIFSTDIIPVYETEKGIKVVIGRELHEKLSLKDRYNDWFPRMCEYGFDKNIDYFSFTENSVKPNLGGRPKKNHILTLDMAKHIAMIQRSKQGFKIRQKLIDLENNLKEQVPTGQELIALALVEAQKVLNNQSKVIEELKPKAEYFDKIMESKALVNIEQIAQDYGMTAQKMNQLLHELKIQYKRDSGQWILYSNYKNKGYVHSKTIGFTHRDGKPDFKMHTKWTQRGRIFLYNILKENGILPVIERDLKVVM